MAENEETPDIQVEDDGSEERDVDSLLIADEPEVEEEVEQVAENDEEQVEESDLEPEPKPSHNFDKGLQALQQEQAALRRELQATKQQLAEAQKPKAPDPLASLIDDDDELADPATRTLAQYTKSLKAELDELKASQAASLRQIQQSQQQLQTERIRAQIESEGLDYDAVVASTQKSLEPFAEQVTSDAEWQRLAAMSWQQQLELARARKSTKPSSPEISSPKPAVKKTDGTRIVGKRAAAGTSHKQNDEEIDDRLIDALLTN